MPIKCVIWDLDNTLWEGVLLEGDEVRLRPGIEETIRTLDSWGILHSIASHNDKTLALKALESFGLRAYFLASQINFTPKPEQITAISQALDLRLEELAYVDDDAFQRAQVSSLLPFVTVFTGQEGVELPARPGLRPERLTTEAGSRKEFYQSRIARSAAETGFAGSRLDFLKSCRLRLVLRPAGQEDVPRIYELIQRTNQLNATAQRYTLGDVQAWLADQGTEVWVGELSDRFGEYGMVGVVVIQKETAPWLVRLLLVSCRAMGRGVGEGLLAFVLRCARQAGQPSLQALYRKTPHNQAMRLLFAAHGFRLVQAISPAAAEASEPVTFQYEMQGELPEYPAWLEVDESAPLAGFRH